MTDEGRLLVVSHPAVVSVNQEPYRELVKRGWEVNIVLPNRWRHAYVEGTVKPEVLAGMENSLRPTRVAFPGMQQRHAYLARCAAICRDMQPDVAFIEAESFSFSAFQWSRALSRSRIPFGVQCAENIDRDLPSPIRRFRAQVLSRAAFVAARSHSAGQLAHDWGAAGRVSLVPHAVPAWSEMSVPKKESFTVGYVGRLVESKGLVDLVDAIRRLQDPVELLLIGNGEMKDELETQSLGASRIRIVSDLSHDQMATGYAQCDIVVLPSRTTPSWKEQFGRVLVEALWCGVPVIGSDSGEIPWVLDVTGGGLIFKEGDSDALAHHIQRLHDDPQLAAKLAATGRDNVKKLFSMAASTDALEDLLTHAVDSSASASAE